LTNGLSEERERWARDITSLVARAELVPAHAVIGAGMVAYAGAFTSQYRTKLEQFWVTKLQENNLPHDPKITMRQFLGIPVKI